MRLCREHGIDTRKRYWDWRAVNKADYLPKVPNRVYTEWESWNAFLGTTNSFEKNTRRKKDAPKKVYLPYWDSVRWVQQQAKHFDLTSMPKWLQFYDEYEIPEGIPKRPDQVYDEYTAESWLGKTLRAQTEAAKNVDKLICLHRIVGQAANVIKLVVWKEGYSNMLSKVDGHHELTMPFKVYVAEQEDDVIVGRRWLEKYGAKQWDDSYIVFNMNELVYELDHALLMFKQ